MASGYGRVQPGRRREESGPSAAADTSRALVLQLAAALSGQSTPPGMLPLSSHDVEHLQRVAGNRAVSSLLMPAARRARRRSLGHGSPSPLQRAMKFELQTPRENFVKRTDGVDDEPLPRKYGPQDFLVKGSSGVRLESETDGQLEFETSWERRWSKLRDQLSEARDMAKKMSKPGRSPFPFDDSHLRAGTRSELRRGKWRRRRGFERNKGETILKPGEHLVVDIGNPAWRMGIQTSESFALEQYESFLNEHEYPSYITPGTAAVDSLMKAVASESKLTGAAAVKLRNFLLIIANYVLRGQGGPVAKASRTFADTKDLPSKQAFLLLSRTDFASIHSLLTRGERRAFRKLVHRGEVSAALGVDPKDPVYVKGYGKTRHFRGPTVRAWLVGITKGRDLLSHRDGKGISGAQGRFGIDRRKGKKHTGLVKFEARGSRVDPFAKADDWVAYGFWQFLAAKTFRKRKGSTKLKW